MPLQFPRDPQTLAGVVECYISILGAKEAAHVIGKSKSLIYRAANDRDDFDLDDWRDFMALDAACVAKGKTAPWVRWYLHKLEGDHTEMAEELIDAALDLHTEVTYAQMAIREAKCPDGPAGEEITHDEACKIKQQTQAVRSQCDAIDARVDQDSRKTIDIAHMGKVS